MKYELTDETQQADGLTFYRIRALADFGDVTPGELGGWLEAESNLSQQGDCWVSGSAWVYGEAQVSGKARVARTPKTLAGLQWEVTICEDHMVIGCQCHTHQQWREFSDDTIASMHLDASEFWAAYRAVLLALCELHAKT